MQMEETQFDFRKFVLLDELLVCVYHVMPMPDKRSFRRTCKKFSSFDISTHEKGFLEKLKINGFDQGIDLVEGEWKPFNLSKWNVRIMEYVYANYTIPEPLLKVDEKDVELWKIFFECARNKCDNALESLEKLGWELGPGYALMGYASTGDIKSLKKYLMIHSDVHSKSTEGAAYGNKLEVLEWLYEQKIYPRVGTYLNAIYGGNLNVLGWLDKKCRVIDNDYYVVALLCNNKNVFDWLVTNNYPYRPTLIVNATTYMDNFETLKWTYSRHGVNCLTIQSFRNSLRNDNFEMAKWINDKLAENGYSTLIVPCEIIMERGLNFLKKIDGSKFAIPIKVCAKFAKKGDLESLKWIHERFLKNNRDKESIYEQMHDDAVKKNHSRLLEWIAEIRLSDELAIYTPKN